MAYATAAELAAAMRLQVTVANQPLLDACLAAAAVEIDHSCGRSAADPLPTTPPDPLANRVNVGRGVEWFKSSDATFGGVGFADTGILRVPTDGFERWAAALIPLAQSFGIG